MIGEWGQWKEQCSENGLSCFARRSKAERVCFAWKAYNDSGTQDNIGHGQSEPLNEAAQVDLLVRSSHGL